MCGIYLTWLNHSIFYVNALFKIAHLHNEIHTNINKGKKVKRNC